MIVSVIMPLFNAQAYLPDALDCVIKQTYEEFELICINDCSSDDTEKILRRFQEKDSRIRILTNERRLGAGLSRNKGIEASKGKHIIFLDGDDIFDEQLLEKACAAMEKYNADITLFEAAYHVPSEKIYMKRYTQRSEEFKEKYCNTPFSFGDFTPEEFPGWSDCPWDKMFSRDFIMDNHLEFQDLPSSNDVYFSQMAMLCAKRAIWLNDSRVLVYAREHTGASRISAHRDPMCAYMALEKLVLELQKRNMLSKAAAFAYYTVKSKLFYLLKIERQEEQKKNFYKFLHDEGIEKLISYGGEYYANVDRYDRYLLEGLRDYPYERGWFQFPDSYFQCCLIHNGDNVCSFISEKLSQNKRLVLWGAGTNGSILLNYLKEHFIQITGVVDRDESKQGTFVHGYEIAKPDYYYESADYILFTSEQIYQETSLNRSDIGAVMVNIWDLLAEGGAVL